ncbi:MAG: tetratricopeptide repeat protein [Bacteroidales bacterium]|nr:tetratricopeptide repeat protein [Bacteroidales bacterium]MCF8458574.1 tetratricopeptide repeat protein [Bacteroidales bacterium]
MKNEHKYKRISLGILLGILLALPLYVLVKTTFPNLQVIENTPKYVGSETCKSCHQEAYKLWQGSHHDKAMDLATDSTVLGNFDNAELEYKGRVHKFFKKDNKYFVITDGEDGQMQEFEVMYVFGFTPLQQYMVEFDRGRIQVLPLTWNTLDKKWYHMADSIYKDQDITHDNWLHWTNQAQNWNSMCADCHSTNLKKGYNPETDEYQTTWSEIDVSCEACHGPSSKHIEWANLAKYARADFENFGLPVKTSNIDNFQYVDQCARCHSRRTAFCDYEPGNGSIYNHINPDLPVEPNYYLDGHIREEDYVYGSFTQSKMYMHDVKCNDCHNVHSAKLLFDGNPLCLQCHKADDYDTPDHHFHKSAGEKGEAIVSESGVVFDVGEGSKCINCHAYGRFYMGVDFRNDHSFRIPRPDLSEKLGTPNACNQCHARESNKWAQSYIEKWYGKSRKQQYGEAFAMAQKNSPGASNTLNRIIADDLYSPVIRATAIEYIGNLPENADSILYRQLQSIDPKIRLSALRAMPLSSTENLTKLLPLLSDETMAIRMETASKLSTLDQPQIPEKYQEGFALAVREYIKALEYNADFPMGKYSLGNLYYNLKQYDKAEKYYLAALNQDKELHAIKVNLAYLYNSIGKPQKSEELFLDYLSHNPKDGNVLYSYGLLLSELGKYRESLEYLLKARAESPGNARIDYNIAMMYDFFKENSQAEKYLKSAIAKDEMNIEFYSALLEFYIKNNETEKARQTARDITNRFPETEGNPELRKWSDGAME